jgi:ribonuclease VapC
MALDAGLLFLASRPYGLSLEDRLCLSAAKRDSLPALAADRNWRAVGSLIGVRIEVIR